MIRTKDISAIVLALTLTTPLWAMPDAAGNDTSGLGMKHSGKDMQDGKWKEKLGLTDDQAAKLKAAMKSHEEAVRPIRQSERDALKKLGEQVKAKAADNDIQATLDQLKTLRQSAEAEHQKLVEATASFLSPTQRAKMLLGMMHRWEHGGMKGHDHNGPGKGSSPAGSHPEGDESEPQG